MATVVLHASEVDNLTLALAAINRLSKLGYGDTRVTPLTTVASLIADIQTFRDLATVNPAARPIIDACADMIRWLGLKTILDTTVVTALLTVIGGAADTTDLRNCVFLHSQMPAGVPVTFDDLSNFQPAA
jgi:hypothetical protein